MPDVYRFPPVSIEAYASSIDDPKRTSQGYTGARRFSQVRDNRATYLIRASGIGSDRNGTANVETLKLFLAGKPPLVQIDTLPAMWWGQRITSSELLSGVPLEWTSGGVDLDWTSGGLDMNWYDTTPFFATAGNDGFEYVDVENLPLGTVINPGQPVIQGALVSSVVNEVTVTGTVTRIRIVGALSEGTVNIGGKVTRNFYIDSIPSSTQTAGAFGYDFSMTEALASDFTTAFNVLDPWTSP